MICDLFIREAGGGGGWEAGVRLSISYDIFRLVDSLNVHVCFVFIYFTDRFTAKQAGNIRR